MFSFEITPLGNLFFGLSFIVFSSLIFIKRENIPLLLLLFSSLGVVFYADDLVTLFIGWEIMSWSSYFIILNRATLKTAQKYIIFNLGASFALLGAIILIYSFTGTFIYEEIYFNKVPISLRAIVYILLFITIFIKSGIIPFHYWVVDTYSESDDIFSAILSAIISKSGIFLFITLFVKIIGYRYIESNLLNIVAWLGIITSIVATFKAITQDEVKRVLAYSSIAQIGYIIAILASLNDNGLEAGLYHTLIHTSVKLLLFINLASIIYVTGRDRFSQLGGLLYNYPTLFILFLIGIIGLAGVPPLGGFNSKFLIYTTLLEEKKPILLIAVMFSSVTAFLYCYKLIYGIYLGQPTDGKGECKKLPNIYYFSQYISATILVILGLMPSLGMKIFNPILISLGFKPNIYGSIFELNSNFGSFNGGIIMTIFIAIFLSILVIVVFMKNQAVKVKDRYDISYCGEVPNSNFNLHYGYGIGEELKRVGFIKLILKNSISSYWDNLSYIVKDLSIIIKRLYSLSIQSIAILTVILFIILISIGAK